MKNFKRYALLASALPLQHSKGFTVPRSKQTAMTQAVTRDFAFPRIEFPKKIIKKIFMPKDALKIALDSKDYERFFYLVDKGADIYIGGSQKSPLHMAFKDKNFPHQKLAYIKAKDSYGNTPLDIAMLYDYRDIFRKIIYTNNFNLPKYQYGSISDGEQSIHSYPNVVFEYAARNKMNDIVDKMLSKNLVDINSPNEIGEKPIFQLISTHRNVLVKKILSEAVDLESTNNRGETLYERALASGNYPIAAYLINKADGTKFNGMLNKALKNNNFPYKELAKLNLTGERFKTLLFCAIANGRKDITKHCIWENKYKITKEDADKYYSIKNNNIISDIMYNIDIDTAKKSIENGYDMNSPNQRGEPLLYDLLNNRSHQDDKPLEMAIFLINREADLNFVTDSGKTLMYAILKYKTSWRGFDKALMETINEKALNYLDNRSKTKMQSILNQYESSDDDFNKSLNYNCQLIIRKYINEKAKNKDSVKSFDKLTDVLQNIIDTRSWHLKKILLVEYLSILYENKIDNEKYNYKKFILEKNIPKGLEAISLLLTTALTQYEKKSCDDIDGNDFIIGVREARERNCPHATNEAIFEKALSLLSARDVRRNGHATKKVLHSILTLNYSFDILPNVPSDLIANIVSVSKTSGELVRNFSNLDNMIMNFELDEIVSCLNRESMGNFEKIYERKLRKTLDIPDSIEGSFSEFYHKFRKPRLLITYFGRMNEIPEVKKVYVEDFIIPCIKGDFYKNIYGEIGKKKEENSHFDIVFKDRQELLEKWKAGNSLEIKAKMPSKNIKPFIMTQTKSPFDMFMLGTETPSCQNAEGVSEFNKCLMGYVLNPCTQAILIKSKEDGSIVARSIFRMLWDEEKKHPVLLLEKNYRSDGLAPLKYEKLIVNYAIYRAKEMGLPLVTDSFPGWGKGSYKSNIVSYDSGKAPYEYCDSGSGITDGRYNLSRGLKFLYNPPFEPRRDSFKNKLEEKILSQKRRTSQIDGLVF